jgi:hypothetical protein
LRFSLLLLSLLFLSSCGNIDQGKVGIPQNTSASATVSTPTSINSSGTTFSNCSSFAVYQGTDPTFASTFNGLQACAGVSNPTKLRIKTTGSFPTSQAFCIVPLTFNGEYAATCFTVNGQADLTLSTGQYTSVAIVRETDLAAYMTYLQGVTLSYPPMGFASVR